MSGYRAHIEDTRNACTLKYLRQRERGHLGGQCLALREISDFHGEED
jgi:hypothetical protein